MTVVGRSSVAVARGEGESLFLRDRLDWLWFLTSEAKGRSKFDLADPVGSILVNKIVRDEKATFFTAVPEEIDARRSFLEINFAQVKTARPRLVAVERSGCDLEK